MFTNITQDVDWAKSFIKVHNLTGRFAKNIKTVRAEIFPEIINYFDNLEVTLSNVPITNIINYDGASFTDDPGNQNFIFRLGVKCAEKIQHHSKGSVLCLLALPLENCFFLI